MLHRRLTFRSVPVCFFAGSIIQSTIMIGLAVVFLPGSIKAEDTVNIAGTWTARDGTWVFHVTQHGNRFHWEGTLGQSANGTIHGRDLKVNWGGTHTSGTVSESDSNNIAMGIDWSTGDHFVRDKVASDEVHTMTGTVSGPDGVAIAGAKVTAMNADNKTVVTTSTANDGSYLIANLSAGVYKVAIEAAGFKKSTLGEVEAYTNQTVRVDAQMKSAGPGFLKRFFARGAAAASDGYVQDSQDGTDDSASTDQQESVQRDRDKHNDNHIDNDRDPGNQEGPHRQVDNPKDNDKDRDRGNDRDGGRNNDNDKDRGNEKGKDKR